MEVFDVTVRTRDKGERKDWIRHFAVIAPTKAHARAAVEEHFEYRAASGFAEKTEITIEGAREPDVGAVHVIQTGMRRG